MRDKRGRLDTIRKRGGSDLVDYTYIGGRVDERAYPQIDVEYEITYNDLGWATRHYTKDTSPSTTTITDFNYTFDYNGNIIEQSFDHRAASPDNDYGYDDLNRLVTIDYIDDTDEEFAYDKLGNRTGQQDLREGAEDYSVNSQTNRYNSVGLDNYYYDDAGNLIEIEQYKYSYDYENRLVQVLTEADELLAEYAYDALGRRIEKYDAVADETTRYYHNNNWQVLTETDENDYALRWYVYGNYIDEVLVMVAEGSPDVNYYYAHDHLYSPVALLDDSGNVVERYEYDAYGKMTRFDPDFTEWSGAEAGNPYYFTGRRVDVLNAGNHTLQYSRNRYYEYDTGRMLQHDPLGYSDSVNLYQYALSQPMMYFDPWGLMQWTNNGGSGNHAVLPNLPEIPRGHTSTNCAVITPVCYPGFENPCCPQQQEPPQITKKLPPQYPYSDPGPPYIPHLTGMCQENPGNGEPKVCCTVKKLLPNFGPGDMGLITYGNNWKTTKITIDNMKGMSPLEVCKCHFKNKNNYGAFVKDIKVKSASLGACYFPGIFEIQSLASTLQDKHFPNWGDPYMGGYRHCVSGCMLVRHHGCIGHLVNFGWDLLHEDSSWKSYPDMQAEKIGRGLAGSNLTCEYACLEIFPPDKIQEEKWLKEMKEKFDSRIIKDPYIMPPYKPKFWLN